MFQAFVEAKVWIVEVSKLEYFEGDSVGDEMTDKVEKLIVVGRWHILLSIREQVIHMLTLEVLALFEFDRSYSSFVTIDSI